MYTPNKRDDFTDSAMNSPDCENKIRKGERFDNSE